MSDLTPERHLALVLAVGLYSGSFNPENNPAEVTTTAGLFWGFLTAPVALSLAAGPVVDQTTGRASNNPGGTSMVAIQDNQKFPLIVSALDAKGDPTTTPTDVTFTSSDTTIVSISAPDANGVTWGVGGNPGSATITGDWPDSPVGDLKGTLAVDVTAGPAASLAISAGSPVAQ